MTLNELNEKSEVLIIYNEMNSWNFKEVPPEITADHIQQGRHLPQEL